MLGPPVVPVLAFFGGQGSPTQIDDRTRKSGTLNPNLSNLEDPGFLLKLGPFLFQPPSFHLVSTVGPNKMISYTYLCIYTYFQ